MERRFESGDCGRADDGQTNSISFDTICLAVERHRRVIITKDRPRNGRRSKMSRKNRLLHERRLLWFRPSWSLSFFTPFVDGRRESLDDRFRRCRHATPRHLIGISIGFAPTRTTITDSIYSLFCNKEKRARHIDR